jgi:2-beta-glucuronyltransferase
MGSSKSPYAGESAGRAVFVGAAYLDRGFIDMAASELTDWEFHVIGPVGSIPARANVVAHGELPFGETVPFIKHADVGLATLRYLPGAESFTDSLKIIQYTYARLPIVAPEFMRSARTNLFTYRPGDRESIRAALLAARAFDRTSVDRSGIGSWEDLARELAGPLAHPGGDG